MDTDASIQENATRIIGLEVAAVGILLQLLCMWNSLNPFDTSNRGLVNFFFGVGTLVVAVGCGVYAKGKRQASRVWTFRHPVDPRVLRSFSSQRQA
jgi:hypothetical protein